MITFRLLYHILLCLDGVCTVILSVKILYFQEELVFLQYSKISPERVFTACNILEIIFNKLNVIFLKAPFVLRKN